MERVIESSRIPPTNVTHIGIAIHRRDEQNEHNGHIGLLYRVAIQAPAQLLHMPWHNKLRSESPGANYVLWVDPSIPKERAKVVAAYCRLVWKKNEANGLPYGLSQPNRFFDHTGGILKGPAKVGLTCATFVLAVFEATGLTLVRYETWPKPADEDIKRQEELARRLEADEQVPRDHVRSFRDEIGNIRYRPHEVAGAATSDSWPSDHKYASRVAKRIRRKLAMIRVGRA